MSAPMDIDFPHLTRDRDRHGRQRLYARIGLGRRIRLRQVEGTPEFALEYAAAVAELRKPPENAAIARVAPETLEWLGRKYMASVEFKRLDRTSQATRRQVLNSCFVEPRKPGAGEKLGACPLAALDARHVKLLRDRRAEQPGAANNRLKYLSALFAWAIEAGHMRANPARDVRRLKYASEGFHTWTVAEVRQFLETHGPGTTARLAMLLMLFTGARRSDAVTLGRQHVQGDVLRFVPRKTRHIKSQAVEVPILPDLATEIANVPHDRLTFLVTVHGRAFTRAGFGDRMRKWCDAAGLPQCTSHGLRKAGATIAAENGATDRQLMAIYNWSSAHQAGTYTRTADRRRLARDGAALIRLDKTGT